MAETLFLAHRIPYPPDRGDKIRSWHLLKHLAARGRVHLACFADDEADLAHLPALREALGGRLGEACVEIRRTSRPAAGLRALIERKPVSLTLFDSSELRRFVNAIVAKPEVDTIFAFSGQMAQFVPEGARQRFLMDFGDVDSAKFADYASRGGPLAWVHRREAARLAAFERATAARADFSLFVSEAEAGLFRTRVAPPDADVRSVQNGVDLRYYDPAARVEKADAPHPLIVFTGQMDYAPNIDAVDWFAREVMPLIPAATFAIVGRKPPKAVRRLASDRVIVTGAVEDVRSWLLAADIVVAPLRIARGIQNKVLEAMAMGRPVVASPAAYEGVDAVVGRDLLVAESRVAQAEAILNLLEDKEAAAAMGAAARCRVEDVYPWDARLAPLDSLLGLARYGEAA